MQSCDGTEELKFYFGVEDDVVRKFKSEFNRPFGFAALTTPVGDRDPHGIVWIAPPRSICPDDSRPTFCLPYWSNETADALEALILHEIGHVFGNSHVDGTAMTSQIGRFLQNDTQLKRDRSFVSRYSRIDAEIDLIICLECAQTYSAAFRFDEIDHVNSDAEHVFKKLTGADPIGSVTIEYYRRSRSQSSNEFHYPGSGILTLKDAIQTVRFDVEVETQAGERKDSSHLFEGMGRTYFTSSSLAYFGKIIRPGVDPLWIVVSYNLDNVKAKIIPLGEGLYTRPVFVSGN
jgi:hypothetical protein